jgi:hypothetical protein
LLSLAIADIPGMETKLALIHAFLTSTPNHFKISGEKSMPAKTLINIAA